MPEEASEISALFADFNTKIKDMEERHEMLKERMLLLSQSFLRHEEKMEREFAIMREDLKETRDDQDRMKENIQHIIREQGELARREDLKILEKYIQLWEPLKFVKEDDVKKMINEKLKK